MVREEGRGERDGGTQEQQHGSFEQRLGEDMTCAQETKYISVFYDVCGLLKYR